MGRMAAPEGSESLSLWESKQRLDNHWYRDSEEDLGKGDKQSNNQVPSSPQT